MSSIGNVSVNPSIQSLALQTGNEGAVNQNLSGLGQQIYNLHPALQAALAQLAGSSSGPDLKIPMPCSFSSGSLGSLPSSVRAKLGTELPV